MRLSFERQACFGQIPIADIRIDLNSRDDTDLILLGLQTLWLDTEARDLVLGLIEEAHGEKADSGNGRPGMSFWEIIVLGVVRQGLACDFDRLTNLGNNHLQLRDMLGHPRELPCSLSGGATYRLETVIRNVSLLDEGLLDQINQVIVKLGHTLVGHRGDMALQGRADSYVVETDVEYPTDLRLFWDALRSAIKRARKLANRHDLPGWRQFKSLLKKLQKAFNRVNRMRKTNKDYGEAVKAYLEMGSQVMAKVRTTLAELASIGLTVDTNDKVADIAHFFSCGETLADQIDRRLLRGEKIPHGEKIFSVFEPHTRWNAKGKAGTPVELGVPVCVVEDQYQFILGTHIMWEGGDRDAIVPLLTRCQMVWPELCAISLDRGYWSPQLFDVLSTKLDLVALPKMGRPNKTEAAREAEPDFVEARRRHPGIESAINMLEQHGMDRILSFGPDGFSRMVGLSVISANLIRIGRLQLRKEQEKHKRGRRSRRLAA